MWNDPSFAVFRKKRLDIGMGNAIFLKVEKKYSVYLCWKQGSANFEAFKKDVTHWYFNAIC